VPGTLAQYEEDGGFGEALDAGSDLPVTAVREPSGSRPSHPVVGMPVVSSVL
jgi:hypothetical protein